MRIKINEKEVEVDENITLDDIKRRFKKDADVIIYNGFPVDTVEKIKDGASIVLIKRGEMPSKDEFETLLTARHTPLVHKKIKSATVGIAGVGGLGSNIAVSLARLGIGNLIIADFDVVEPSNLNRQYYFADQIGMYKVDALSDTLRRINPYINLISYRRRIDETNIKEIFSDASVLVEAFDKAEYKARFVNFILLNMSDKYVVAASGMAGYGDANLITTKRISEKFFLCGDGVSEAKPGNGLMAPRVGVCANHQANVVLRILLGEE